MFETHFSGHNKICGEMPPGGYGPGSRYKKGWKPLVHRTNFQGSLKLQQRQSKKELQWE